MDSCLKNRLHLLSNILPDDGLLAFTKNRCDDATTERQNDGSELMYSNAKHTHTHTNSSLKVLVWFYYYRGVELHSHVYTSASFRVITVCWKVKYVNRLGWSSHNKQFQTHIPTPMTAWKQITALSNRNLWKQWIYFFLKFTFFQKYEKWKTKTYNIDRLLNRVSWHHWKRLGHNHII